MKNLKTKLVALVMTISMLLSIFCVPAKAATYEKVILKKSEDQFLIYYENICNEEFDFAISTNPSAEERTLSFKHSVPDQNTENQLNVAFIDETNYIGNEFYIWVMDGNDNLIVTADKVDLTDALDEEKIDLINTTTIVDEETNRIKVNTTKTHQTNQIIDGVDTTVTTGKIVIEGNGNYEYVLIKVSDDNNDAKELFETAEKLENKVDNTYNNLSLAKKFYDLYNKLMPKDSEWTAVDNSEILQPEDAYEGDKYIAYIKDGKSNIVDAKFLKCKYQADQGVAKKEETKTEVVKLPVTYDSGVILFIILGIIVLALFVFIIAKAKSNKKGKH